MGRGEKDRRRAQRTPQTKKEKLILGKGGNSREKEETRPARGNLRGERPETTEKWKCKNKQATSSSGHGRGEGNEEREEGRRGTRRKRNIKLCRHRKEKDGKGQKKLTVWPKDVTAANGGGTGGAKEKTKRRGIDRISRAQAVTKSPIRPRCWRMRKEIWAQ